VSVLIPSVAAEERVLSHPAQLNLVDIADVHQIQSFEAAELGLTFIYFTPQKQADRKLAHQKAGPQAAPGSQVTENKTSIAVHTGR
jgi:hypothetical protein